MSVSFVAVQPVPWRADLVSAESVLVSAESCHPECSSCFCTKDLLIRQLLVMYCFKATAFQDEMLNAMDGVFGAMKQYMTSSCLIRRSFVQKQELHSG